MSEVQPAVELEEVQAPDDNKEKAEVTPQIEPTPDPNEDATSPKDQPGDVAITSQEPDPLELSKHTIEDFPHEDVSFWRIVAILLWKNYLQYVKRR